MKYTKDNIIGLKFKSLDGVICEIERLGNNDNVKIIHYEDDDECNTTFYPICDVLLYLKNNSWQIINKSFTMKER